MSEPLLKLKKGIEVQRVVHKEIYGENNLIVDLIELPCEEDWMEVKRRALVTVGLNPINAPDDEWKKKILECRHSPIRRLRFSFALYNLPYYISVHFVRHHVGIEKYVRSQRNDRQSDYDRTKAPQDAPVNMIMDFNGESLLEFFNKRLCGCAAKETREVVQLMAMLVKENCPEFVDFIEPMCFRNGGVCHEMKCCGKFAEYKKRSLQE